VLLAVKINNAVGEAVTAA
jgi:WD40 repeat protein